MYLQGSFITVTDDFDNFINIWWNWSTLQNRLNSGLEILFWIRKILPSEPSERHVGLYRASLQHEYCLQKTLDHAVTL